MHELTIKTMVIEDYEQVMQLWQNSAGIGLSEADSRDKIAFFLERNPALSFVAKSNDVVVAAVLCGHDGRRGYIYHLFVGEQYRRQGLGKKLVSRCLARLKEAGITKCHLFTMQNNELGQAFWNKTSWEKRTDIAVFSHTS